MGSSLLNTRRIFVFIFSAGLFVLALRPVTDPDIGWHLRTGELIARNHAVFHTDPYSFTKFGQTWVNHEWLSDVLIFAIFRVSGFSGLTIAFALITAAAFSLVFSRCSNRPYWAAAFAVWAAITSAPAWGVRPQIFSLFLASLFLFILEKSYGRTNSLWYLVPLMVVWVNLHAGFALGIGLIALFLVGDVLDAWFRSEAWDGDPARQLRRHAQRLGITLLACLAVIPLNPYGARMYLYPLDTVHSRAIQSYISEWLSPNFHAAMYVPLLLMILAVFAAVAISPERVRPRNLLLLSATLWAALQSARHAPIFALVAAPVLSDAVSQWLQQKQAQRPQQTKITSSAAGLRLFNGFALAAFLVFAAARVRHTLNMQKFSQSEAFPVAATSFLIENRLPQPVFNPYNWGGYFIWRLYPEYRVFVDGRSDLYGDAFLKRFAAIYQISGASWKQDFDQWKIRTVILPPDAPLVSALRLRPAWKQVYADRQAVILVDSKQTLPNQ